MLCRVNSYDLLLYQRRSSRKLTESKPALFISASAIDEGEFGDFMSKFTITTKSSFGKGIGIAAVPITLTLLPAIPLSVRDTGVILPMTPNS
jgi:hypothetical protein